MIQADGGCIDDSLSGGLVRIEDYTMGRPRAVSQSNCFEILILSYPTISSNILKSVVPCSNVPMTSEDCLLFIFATSHG